MLTKWALRRMEPRESDVSYKCIGQMWTTFARLQKSIPSDNIFLRDNEYISYTNMNETCIGYSFIFEPNVKLQNLTVPENE